MSKLKIEITEEQIQEATRSIVDEDLPDVVRAAVERYGEKLLQERVREKIGPVIDAAMASEKFVVSRAFSLRMPIENAVKNAVVQYLDERIYLYSKTSDVPSERLKQTSSGGITRLEGFLRFTVERFCDEYLIQKLEATVKDFLDKRGGIEAVAKQEMAALLAAKFKL